METAAIPPSMLVTRYMSTFDPETGQWIDRPPVEFIYVPQEPNWCSEISADEAD